MPWAETMGHMAPAPDSSQREAARALVIAKRLREVEESIADIPGTDGISAVAEDRILAMPMNMTEPATPQAVDGLERIVEEFQQ